MPKNERPNPSFLVVSLSDPTRVSRIETVLAAVI